MTPAVLDCVIFRVRLPKLNMVFVPCHLQVQLIYKPVPSLLSSFCENMLFVPEPGACGQNVRIGVSTPCVRSSNLRSLLPFLRRFEFGDS